MHCAMNFNFQMPTRLTFGSRAIEQAGNLAAELGRRILFVTSRSAMARFGYADRLLADFDRHQLVVKQFCAKNPSPSVADVDLGVAEAQSHNAEVVVALGGGSVLDCAKAIAGVYPSNRPAADFLYQRANVESNALPVICIPTTAGTGSEINGSAIITDPDRPFKDGIRSKYLFPRYALVDPQLTWSVPRQVTAQTGFDTLAHAIESYVSPKAMPITDDLARRAMQVVCHYLPIVLDSPRHEEGREWLAYASTTMGINLACVGTCFPHRADKSLCAMRPEIAHGQSVAFFYPYWIRSCYHAVPDKFAEVAQVLAKGISRDSTSKAAASCPRLMADFIRGIGLSLGLHTVLSEHDMPQLVAGVAGDLSINPVVIQRDALSELFLNMLQESEQ